VLVCRRGSFETVIIYGIQSPECWYEDRYLVLKVQTSGSRVWHGMNERISYGAVWPQGLELVRSIEGQ